MGFEELGLRPELVGALTALGYEDPTPLQHAAIPVIRRGANVVLRASAGAGVTAAYGVGVVDRLAGSAAADLAAPRALVIVPTADRASHVADAIACFAARTPLRVRASAPGWQRGPADVRVTSADAALRAVRDSSLKLDRLEVFVLADAMGVAALEPPGTVDALAVALPPGAQRILTAGELSRDIEAFVQAHVRRAIEIPPRPIPTPGDTRRVGVEPGAQPSRRGSLAYLVVTDHDKPSALAELLGRPAEPGRVVIARTGARAAAVREQLERRGFTVSDDALAAAAGRDDVIAVIGALDAPRATYAYDVPADPRVLERIEPETGVVLVTTRELPHLRSLAAETGFELKAIERRPRRGDVAAFRERVRRAVRDEDVDAQLLVLEPLFDEFSAAELAAALSAMLRQRAPEREVPGRAAGSAEPAEAPEEPSRPAPFVRLFVSVGQKDGLRPADIVGAFTAEANIGGAQIGRIEIRDTFTVVEVESGTADRVIRALNGTTLRSRSIRVDYDRKTTTAPRRTHRPRL